jgi:hypothetical protein
MPSRAKQALCRFSGKCIPYLPNTTSASRFGPARPRAIGWNGAGASLMLSHDRQETFSRTCWTTNQRRQPLQALGDLLAQLAHRAATAGTGDGRRVDAALACAVLWAAVGLCSAARNSPAASASATLSCNSVSTSSSCSSRALRSDEVPNRCRRSRAISSFRRSISRSRTRCVCLPSPPQLRRQAGLRARRGSSRALRRARRQRVGDRRHPHP